MTESKKGRPTTEPRQHRESFRMSDRDMEMIQYCMGHLGLSKTDVVRLGISRLYQETAGEKG